MTKAVIDKYESYKVLTYGNRVILTREMIVNDDLSAFTRIPVELGRMGKRKIDDLVYALLATNSAMGPTMAEDSAYLFSVVAGSRGQLNYWASASTALMDATGLGYGKRYLRSIKGLNSDEYLNLTPSFLIVPVALEQAARTLLFSSNVLPVSTTGGPTGNLWQNALTIVVDPRIDAGTDGTTTWYMAASPALQESVVVAFLGGNETPILEKIAVGSETLGDGWRVYFDVGVAAIDWRGIVRSKGSA
jgi:phage major head subunit gpT-like protein